MSAFGGKVDIDPNAAMFVLIPKLAFCAKAPSEGK